MDLRRREWDGLWRATATALLAVACAREPGGARAPAAVEVSPASLALRTGESRALQARAIDDAGNTISARIFWSSAQPSVATVSPQGVVTAVTPGRVNVAASVRGISALVGVNVQALAVTVVRVTPALLSVRAGESALVRADAVLSDGTVDPARNITWTSSDPAIAVVSAAGVVAGVSVGTATIFARSDGATGTGTVQVQLPSLSRVVVAPSSGALLVGQSLQFDARGFNAAGSPIAGHATRWQSSEPTIVLVSSSGLATALAPGRADITATSDGIDGKAVVTTALVPVRVVTVSPATVSLLPGQGAALFARAFDSAGTVLGERVVRWASDRPDVAVVSSSGVLTAISSGDASIDATIDGVVGRARVNVGLVPVASIQVVPGALALRLGDARALVATPLDAQGQPLANRPLTWRSGGPSVATVDQRGVVTAVGVGAALIEVTCEGQRASVSVTGTPIVAGTITVSPNTGSLLPGATLQLVAAVTDDRGAAMPGATVTWTSTAPANASVSPAGLVTAITTGSASVQASLDGVVGASAIRVLPITAATVTVAPTPVVVVEGGSVSVTATPRDARGLPVPGATVTFAVADSTVATVSPTGVVKAILAGGTTLTVQAAAAGQLVPVTATATVTVTPQPPGRIVITPLTGTLHIGPLYARTATARAFDAAGNPVSTAQVVWSSASASLSVAGSGGTATLSATGVPTPGLRLVATLPGRTAVADTISIDSDLVPVAALALAPTFVTLVQGQSQLFVVTARDSAGNDLGAPPATSLGNRTASWTVPGIVASVSPGTGMSATVTATSPGAAVLSATLGGVVATASITVTPLVPVVDTITVVPGALLSLRIGIGSSSREKFIVVSTLGAPIAGQAFAVSSSNTQVLAATVFGPAVTDAAGTGQFTATVSSRARKGDTASVTVSAGGKQTSWTVTVR